MSCSNEYRDYAAKQREAAGACALPMVRLRHLVSAQRWERLAEETEQFELQTRSQPRTELFY